MTPDQAIIDSALEREDALALLRHVTGQSRAWLLARAREPLPVRAIAEFRVLAARRRAGEPVAYLVGRRGFWTLDLATSPGALIPRPETELLVEQALARIPAGAAARVLDLGTGTGAVALAIAVERPAAFVVATERSAEALALARHNVATLAPGRVALVRGDWLASIGEAGFDVVVANPPYIAQDDPHLHQGDLRFEPRCALASGPEGLDALAGIIAEAGRCLRPEGWVLVEHGFAQGEAVRALFAGRGFRGVTTVRDLAGRERVTSGST